MQPKETAMAVSASTESIHPHQLMQQHSALLLMARRQRSSIASLGPAMAPQLPVAPSVDHGQERSFEQEVLDSLKMSGSTAAQLMSHNATSADGDAVVRQRSATADASVSMSLDASRGLSSSRSMPLASPLNVVEESISNSIPPPITSPQSADADTVSPTRTVSSTHSSWRQRFMSKITGRASHGHSPSSSVDLMARSVPPLLVDGVRVRLRRVPKHLDTLNATMTMPKMDDQEAAQRVTAYLQLAIALHERGDLTGSAWNFSLAADLGAPLGLYFMGVALRHGWGVKVDAQRAFQYLYRAAECAMMRAAHDLATTGAVAGHCVPGSHGPPFKTRSPAAGTADAIALRIVQTELGLILYELAVSYQRGWGLPRADQSTAAYYYHIAARLGDGDAQNEIASCYAHGRGLTRRMRAAALFYRRAAKQGQGVVGNSWIDKDKYNDVEKDASLWHDILVDARSLQSDSEEDFEENAGQTSIS